MRNDPASRVGRRWVRRLFVVAFALAAAVLVGMGAALVVPRLSEHAAAPRPPDLAPAAEPAAPVPGPRATAECTVPEESDDEDSEDSDDDSRAESAERRCVGELPLAAKRSLRYYSNYPLTGNPEVTHAIVVVHGAGRNARSSFTGMTQEVAGQRASDRTLVLAPSFQTKEDDPASNEARWTDEAWKEGGDATKPAGVSSFNAMDMIFDQLADRSKFPKLNWITLAGHSAGGQFAQRYAAVGQAPDRLRGVAVNYVVANPSTYLYLNPERPDLTDTAGKRFAVPKTSCTDYDDYKYGLRDRDRYAGGEDPAQIVRRYTTARVTYLSGEQDVESEELDTNCQAMLQGANRFVRSELYLNYVKTFFPPAPHNRAVVPGIGHDRADMFASEQGIQALFNGPNPSGAPAR